MEVESLVVDQISKDRATTEQSSCFKSQQSTVDQKAETMAATASQVPLRFFPDASSIAAAQFYSSNELYKPATKTERVKKRRYSPPSPPASQPLAQDERKVFTQVAPFNRGFGESDSFRRFSGLVVCPHLHPLAHEPDRSGSNQRTTKYCSAATFIAAAATSDEEEQSSVAVHRLDTRSEATDERLSPLTHVNDDDERRTTVADRYSVSPPPLPVPYVDSLTSAEHGSWTEGASGDEDPPSTPSVSTGSLGVGSNKTTVQAVVAESTTQEASNGARDGVKSSTEETKRHLLHRPLARQRAARNASNDIANKRLSPTNHVSSSDHDIASSTTSNNSKVSKLLLISPEHNTPVVLGRTKPVPPPRTPPSEINRQCKIPSPVNDQCRDCSPQDRKLFSSNRHPTKILQSTVSSPSILSDSISPFQRSRKVSFHHCSAGEAMGQFRADYLGSKEVDNYIGMVNSVARQLVDQRPAEVIAYVSSQKVRLAPSKNESVLFKSFAIKDILMVEKCAINKRIIGIVVWKFKTRPPTCHILRCSDEIVSKSLYEAVWEQTQVYDDITLNKVSQLITIPRDNSPLYGIMSCIDHARLLLLGVCAYN